MLKKVEKIKRTEKGSATIGRFIPLIIVIVSVSMLIVTYTDYIRVLDIKDEISLTMRKYIIRMETSGFLNVDDSNSLVKELNELGVKDVDLTGTTTDEVDYGDTIVLKVSGNLVVDTYNIISLFEGSDDTEIISISEMRSSTSQN